MNYKIKNYVDKLFADKSDEPSVDSIKEELLANLTDKFNDLINEGKSLDEAYLLVISSIGEINELLHTSTQDNDNLLKEEKSSNNLQGIIIKEKNKKSLIKQ